MAWLRLALVVNGFLLALFTWGSVQSRGLMTYAANDYSTFRSAAAIARDHGYASVYDERLLDAYQRPLVEAFGSALGKAEFVPITVPFPPAFLIGFQPLLWLPPLASLFAWSAVSILVMSLSFWPWVRGARGNIRSTLLAASLLSLPVFLTLLFGQVTAWMCLGLAGFLQSMRQGRGFRAGLWLTLLFVKPQSLIVLAPGLLLGRRFRAALGLAVGAAFVMAVSLALTGPDGMARLMSLYLRYPGDLPHTYPESMMNWRAIATQLNQALDWPGWIWLAALAAVASLVAGLALWRRHGQTTEPVMMAGLVAAAYAAAGLAGWHSHVHMAAPVLVPLLTLWMSARWRAYIVAWLLLPTFAFSLTGILFGPGPAHRLAALMMAGLNFLALWLAWKSPPAEAGVTGESLG